MIPVFIGVTIILFILRAPGILPGDPVRMITGEKAISEDLYNQIVERYGFDDPLIVQYFNYLGNLLQGDLGDSYQKGRSVSEILLDKLPNTIKLAVAAIIIEMIFGISAGVISAIKRYSFWDVLVTLSTSVLVSVPVFWLGMLLQIMFGIKFKQWGLPYLPDLGHDVARVPDHHPHHPAGHHSGCGLDGVLRPHPAQPTAGGHRPGLHPYGFGEGALVPAGHRRPRHEERPDPGGHVLGSRPGGHDRRHHTDGDRLQLAGDRLRDVPGHQHSGTGPSSWEVRSSSWCWS